MQKFSFEELYNAYKDCIKNKKSSKDYLEYDLKYKLYEEFIISSKSK